MVERTGIRPPPGCEKPRKPMSKHFSIWICVKFKNSISIFSGAIPRTCPNPARAKINTNYRPVFVNFAPKSFFNRFHVPPLSHVPARIWVQPVACTSPDNSAFLCSDVGRVAENFAGRVTCYVTNVRNMVTFVFYFRIKHLEGNSLVNAILALLSARPAFRLG